jgi:Predicted transcriptional regulator
MQNRAVISEAEWPIMECLWEAGSATASEIASYALERTNVTKGTIKTHIRRLVAKKLIAYAIDPDDSRVYHYRPLVSKGDAIKKRNRAFLDFLYNNDPVTLLDSFVDDHSLGDDEIRELHLLLERKRREKK